MQFGIQFFPDVGPQHKAADQYFDEALKLVDMVDPLGYSHVRIVEHATMQVNFHNLDFAEAERSMRMFAEEVMPVFGQGVK